MSLLDLIQIIPPNENEEGPEDPEDIFASAPGLIFPDDTRNMHSNVIYKSKRFGDIELRTADPEQEADRQLFAHYLWNAGIKMAELISQESDLRWSVKDERVLELGAGVGLNGITATLAGAREVVISDYPSSPVLDNLRRNAKTAIPPNLSESYTIQGYIWGDITSPFALQNANSFTRVIAADCYWMPHEHENLVRSMLHMLADDGRVLAISGFHTGRTKLAGFFDVAIREGLEVEEIYEEDVDGNRREWLKERDGGREDPTERKRWLVIAVLKQAKK